MSGSDILFFREYQGGILLALHYSNFTRPHPEAFDSREYCPPFEADTRR